MEERELLVRYLTEKAKEIRLEVIKMIHQAQSGHPGGSLSAADLVAALYFHELKLDPSKPDWPDRDRFILSKGHACPVLYAALCLRGYFEKHVLGNLRAFGSPLQGHPDMKKTPGLDATTGSLGQGLSIGVGMAIGALMSRRKSRIFVLMGDGELNEGQVWEAALSAAKYRLGNLVVIVDKNGLQNDGRTEDIMPMGVIEDKWRAFDWRTRAIDGHNFDEILDALEWASMECECPSVIIANTVKGRGVSFMENEVTWHSGAISGSQLEQAIAELEGKWS